MSRETLLIRADAGERMGTGHVMRCLALAQAAQDAGGAAVLAAAQSLPGIDARLRREGIAVEHLAVVAGSSADAAATADAARTHRAEWVVVDGYQFRGEFQRALKAAGLKILAVDDFGHAEHYWADWVLNQDVYARAELYQAREDYTRLLLGTQFVFLRREFFCCPRPQATAPDAARRLLITLGGSDPTNTTVKLLHALEDARGEGIEAVVVAGPGNVHYKEIEAMAATRPGRFCVLHNPRNMPELMQQCDLALSAGGSTMWELAYFRVPTIVLVLLENQVCTARVLKEMGACRVLDDALKMGPAALGEEIFALAADAAARRAYAEKFGALIDGRGAERVCETLRGK